MLNLLRDLRNLIRVAGLLRGVHPRCCPVCGYEGYFRVAGLLPRVDARCPRCDSLARHRLFVLTDREHDILGHNLHVLHFAPEACLREYIRSRTGAYETADLFMEGVDHKENIEAMTFPDESFDAVICNHVLEHIDDFKTLSEIYRILRPGGRFLAMVPIVEGWETTYENSSITDPKERTLHFGRYNHLRFYGADFRSRLAEYGFDLDEFTATGPDSVTYGLDRGEKVFLGRK